MKQSCRVYAPYLPRAALDAHEPNQEQAVRHHATRCRDRTHAEFEAIATVLGAAVIQVASPSTLEERVVAAARGREAPTQETSQ